MKKIFCILTLTLFALGGSLFAAGKGGFVQSGDAGYLHTSRLFEVKQAPDDTIVRVVGYILEELGDDEYLFKEVESSDTIIVEIDADKWGGQTVTPHDKVRLLGEVDKDRGKVKIDVKRVYKIRDAKPDEVEGNSSKSPASGCTSCGCGTPAPAKN